MTTSKNTSNRIVEFSTLESKCAYLPQKRARMQYKYISNCSSVLNSQLVKRGWRRFGEYFSRPQCMNCQECLNLRIDAQNFEFSRNDRRTLKKNTNTKVIIRQPSITAEHLNLYNKYHKIMEEKKGWKHYNLSMQSYYELYIAGHGEFGKEILYFIDNKLVGVDLVDVVEDGLSSIYCFYDPDYDKFSLGRYSLYQQILLTLHHNMRWVYLGYYVKDCPSLSYKANYKPYEILQGFPELEEIAYWE